MGDKIETLSFDGKPILFRDRKKDKVLKRTSVSHGRIITLPKAVKDYSGLNDIREIAWILNNSKLYVEFYGNRE